MAETYKTRYGVDWPKEIPDPFIGMLIGKKWRQFRKERGVEFKDPWVPLLDAARYLLPADKFRVSRWTEEHFHDWVMAEKGAVTIGAAASGKGFLPSERVWFPDRPGVIGEVKPGDEIISATGFPARVLGVYDHENLPLYRVRFDDGTEEICDENHLWTVQYWGRLRRDVGPSGFKDRPVMGWKTETVPVRRLASWKPGRLRKRYVSVPLTKPVRFSGSAELPIDPYVLGCLIGDGSLHGTVLLTSHPDDRAVRDRVADRLPPGYFLKRVGSSKTSYMIVKESGSKTKNAIVTALKDLGLYGKRAEEKFVPSVYKFAGAEVREELLAGLMDTDGTIDRLGHPSFSTASPRLAEDVRFLVESLGGSATLSVNRTSYPLHGKQLEGLPSHDLYIKGFSAEGTARLFRLPRKLARVRELRKRSGRKHIYSVEQVADRSSYPSRTRCITIGKTDVVGNPTNGLFLVDHFTVTHNSNDYGLLMLLDWATDPFDTAIRLGSTDKISLKSRSWEAVLRYFMLLKHNDKGLLFPGKVSKTGFAILNDDRDESAESIGEKAGIIGVAVNDSEDSGKLQGAHAKFVRLVIDELATIDHHQNIRKAIVNLRVGADFRFFALANPESWENESCRYIIPKDGISSVDVDTGFWVSSSGYLVRHHDGYKSPALESPEKAKEFPFLMTRDVIDANLADCDGNEDAPLFWQMVRGFPPPTGKGIPTVLDPKVADDQRVTYPAPAGSRVVGCAAGIDPAWSEGGDGACYSNCKLRVANDGSYPILDFSDLYKFQIKASSSDPVTLQLRNQALAVMNDPGKYTAPLSATGVDASGNQGLADDLDIYVGQGVTRTVHVNFSERASELPVRYGSSTPGNRKYRDRATEAWCTLALYCKAGMVRGLPERVLAALTKRRFVTPRGSVIPREPLALEPKEEFKQRAFGGKSPDEADAAAIAALMVKEVLGVLPYGWLPKADRPLAEAKGTVAYAQASLPVSEALDEGVEGVDSLDAVSSAVDGLDALLIQ